MPVGHAPCGVLGGLTQPGEGDGIRVVGTDGQGDGHFERGTR